MECERAGLEQFRIVLNRAQQLVDDRLSECKVFRVGASSAGTGLSGRIAKSCAPAQHCAWYAGIHLAIE